MNSKFSNDLRFFTLANNESPTMAEEMAVKFEEKFSLLDKYDQMEMSWKIQQDGWEKAFEELEIY